MCGRSVPVDLPRACTVCVVGRWGSCALAAEVAALQRSQAFLLGWSAADRDGVEKLHASGPSWAAAAAAWKLMGMWLHGRE